MNNSRTHTATVLNRRHFLESLSLAAASQIAGCGETKKGDSGGPTGDRSSSQNRTESPSQKINKETEEIESVFDALADLPIEKGGKFVFDVEQFDNEFDHRTLVETCESIKTELRSIDVPEEEDSRVTVLVTVTEIAKRLVQQRVVLHQVIAAGLEFRKEFYRPNFERAEEVMTDARRYVTHLETLGIDLEDYLKKLDGNSLSIDGFDQDSIEGDQGLLLNIALWTEPAYAGLHLVSRGLETFTEGNSALEDERYGEAEKIYSDSHDHFGRAQEAFRRAQNQGTRLPYLAPFVDEVRCILPAYLDSTTGLSESMGYLHRGEEKRGKDIAREAFKLADQAEAKCE